MTDDERFEAEGELVEQHPIGSKGEVAIKTAWSFACEILGCSSDLPESEQSDLPWHKKGCKLLRDKIKARDCEVRAVVRDEMISEIRESMDHHNRQISAAALREAAAFPGRSGFIHRKILLALAERAEHGSVNSNWLSQPKNARCVRCFAQYAEDGSCTRRKDGCQGGRGEWNKLDQEIARIRINAK